LLKRSEKTIWGNQPSMATLYWSSGSKNTYQTTKKAKKR